MEEQETFDISTHHLVPRHSKLTEEEKQQLLNYHNIAPSQLPEIHADDPALVLLNAQEGDVIKIIRKSPTIGESAFYRRVVNG